MSSVNKTMRDVFLEEVFCQMAADRKVFFLTADFGAPALDRIRKEFPERFINVGIAEQNLINVATGLALEGFCVYAYAIAPFITMRCYEQIKVNLALLSQLRELNVNLIGVGAGFSYVVSGPTHHAIEDISIMRTLPGIELLSPADWVMARDMARFARRFRRPKYFRFDSQPQPALYVENSSPFRQRGFNLLAAGKEICLVATGYMVHQAIAVREKLSFSGIKAAVIDLYRLQYCDEAALARQLSRYCGVVTMEEALTGKGGLDAMILNLKNNFDLKFKSRSIGIAGEYHFELGNRNRLLDNYHAGIAGTIAAVEELL